MFAIAVEGVTVPVCVSNPVPTMSEGGKQKTAFSAGTGNFGMGPKSEPRERGRPPFS